ncbi:MAG: HlyD family type I secretion periplasmic adaptor subunit [Sinimarinibacterium sp.]|jgi:adhesin transport system membrane fusion protein
MNGGPSLQDRLRSRLQRLLQEWVPLAPDANAGWGTDADWAQLQQEPVRARALLRWSGLVLAVLLLWASVAHVDEVAKGEGRVIPSTQLQIVQSVDGGVVEQLMVREGQEVAQGALLLRIDPTRFESNVRDNRGQYLALRVRAARLVALTEALEFQPPAAEAAEAPELVGRERSLFESSRAELDAGVEIARDQVEQRQKEVQGARARYNQASEGLDLATQELNVTRPLIKSGAVSEVEVLRLERQVSALSGERLQAYAQMQQAVSALTEANRKIEEVELGFRNRWRNELAETMAKLNSLSETSYALADRVTKAEVRSPVRGTVKRLLVNTVGGVVQPGQELIEIVPLDDALLLETKIRPRDIAFLRPHQPAMVKFTAYDFSIYGGLEAELEQIGADTVIDDKGNAFYVVRVRTHETSLGDDLPIIPGMVAEVDIITGQKTVLSYLLKPVLRAHSNALRER